MHGVGAMISRISSGADRRVHSIRVEPERLVESSRGQAAAPPPVTVPLFRSDPEGVVCLRMVSCASRGDPFRVETYIAASLPWVTLRSPTATVDQPFRLNPRRKWEDY